MSVRGLVQYGVMWMVTIPLACVVILCALLGWRRAAYRPIVLWCHCLKLVTGVRYTLSGAQNIPEDGRCIIISNHASHLDGPCLITALPFPIYFVIKKELTRIPLWGYAVVRAGFIPIDRSDSDKARRQMAAAVDAIQAGRNVLVFPEGTRSPDGALLPFKRGGFHLAVASQVPILPIAVRGSRALWPKQSFSPSPGHFEIFVGEPISTSGLAAEQVAELARGTRERIQQLLESA